MSPGKLAEYIRVLRAGGVSSYEQTAEGDTVRIVLAPERPATVDHVAAKPSPDTPSEQALDKLCTDLGVTRDQAREIVAHAF
jgi:hypothetical protein